LEKVHKVVTIKCAILIEEKRMEYYQDELAKFTDEDEMLKLDSKVEKSAATLIPFKNYCEEFEHYAMTDKSAISAQQLRLKYNHICLYDEDNLINNDGDADYQPYSINQELFDMISECPDPYNSSRILINLPP
jgi:hypothetical protein